MYEIMEFLQTNNYSQWEDRRDRFTSNSVPTLEDAEMQEREYELYDDRQTKTIVIVILLADP